jgi:hypothetical protein
LNERVQDVENAVAAPGVRRFTENLYLFLVIPLSRDTIPVGAERVELVNKLVDNVPCPVVLVKKLKYAIKVGLGVAHRRRFEINWSVRVQDEMEQAAIVIVTGKFDL